MRTDVDYDFLEAKEKGNIFERLYHKKRIEKIISITNYKNKKVLDIGCGTGSVSLELRKDNVDVIGIDVSKWCIRRARKHQLDRNLLYNLVIGDIFNLPFKNSCFDTITLADVVEHLPNREEVLTEVKRTMKNGGVVIVTVPWKYNPVWHFKLKKIFSGRKDIENEPIHDSFSKKEIEKTFDMFKLKKYEVYSYFGEVVAVLKKER
jgi:ubiquinone/menaquinone biosynthesis C-methylase UbiE